MIKARPQGVKHACGKLAPARLLTLRSNNNDMNSKDDKKPPRFSDPEKIRTVPLKHSATPSGDEDLEHVDLYAEDDRPTEEISAFGSGTDDRIEEEEKDLELVLPMEAEQEHGLIDATAPSTIPELTPPPQAVASAFAAADQDSARHSEEHTDLSVSEELMPVHVYIPEGASGTGTDSDGAAPNNPLRDTGVKPLDISQFETREPPPKREKVQIIRVESPDAPPGRERRRSRLSVRDLILILLVILLGVAIYFTWQVYQDYKASKQTTAPASKSAPESTGK